MSGRSSWAGDGGSSKRTEESNSILAFIRVHLWLIPSPCLPEMVRPQLAERGAAGQPERQVEVGLEVGQDLADALLASGREAVSIGPAQEDGAGPQRDGLDHVDTAANPAVEEDGGAVFYGPDDLGERIECGDRPVELPPTVVRDDHAVGAVVNGLPRVVGVEDALEEDRQRGDLAEPLQVGPGARGVGEDPGEVFQSAPGVLAGVGPDPGAEHG